MARASHDLREHAANSDDDDDDNSTPSSSSPRANSSSSLRWQRYCALATVTAVSYVCFLRGNGAFSIMDNTEPKFAICAKNMLRSGDWLTPTWNGMLRFDKPPLVYWLQALAYALFGYSEWATRLPTALSAMAVTFATYVVGARYYDSRSPDDDNDDDDDDGGRGGGGRGSGNGVNILAGVVAACAFACNLYAVGWARSGVSDMVLCAMVTGALTSFFTAYTSPSRHARSRWHYAFFIFCALAVLTKGPLGAFLPAAVANLFLLYVGQWRRVALREMPLARGVALASAICLPWYALIVRRHGASYIKAFFGYHNLARLTTAVNAHAGPWYYYLLCTAVGLLPWAALAPAALVRVGRPWRRAYWRDLPRRCGRRARARQLPAFVALWYIFTVLFFSSIKTKLFSYILPGNPAVAVLIGAYAARMFDARAQSRPPGAVEACATAGASAASMLAMAWLGANVASVVQGSSNGGGDPWIISYCVQQIRAMRMPLRGSAPWLLGAAACLATAAARRSLHRWLFVPCATAFTLFLVAFLQPAVCVWDAAHQRPLRELAEIVREQHTQPPRSIAGYRGGSAGSDAGSPARASPRIYMLVFGWCDGMAEGQPSVVWYSDSNQWHFAERAEETLAAIVADATAAPARPTPRLDARPADAPARSAKELRDVAASLPTPPSGSQVLVLADESIWRTLPARVRGAAQIARRGPFVLLRVEARAAHQALRALAKHGGTRPFRRTSATATTATTTTKTTPPFTAAARPRSAP